ncbi:MAG: hypothetical protein II806_03965, partial [Bacteroidaceae bacterium]|nr:hypothetical protein [Bacteroidaceae bacterium]
VQSQITKISIHFRGSEPVRNMMHDICVFIFPSKIFAVSENNRTFAKQSACWGYDAQRDVRSTFNLTKYVFEDENER